MVNALDSEMLKGQLVLLNDHLNISQMKRSEPTADRCGNKHKTMDSG